QLRPCLRTKFPANREINREFCKFGASAAISASSQRANSKACRQIPYATEQGIFAAITGNFFAITGKFNRASSEIAELLSDVELARLLMSTPHFCDIGRSVDFPPLAEERSQQPAPGVRGNEPWNGAEVLTRRSCSAQQGGSARGSFVRVRSAGAVPSSSADTIRGETKASGANSRMCRWAFPSR